MLKKFMAAALLFFCVHTANAQFVKVSVGIRGEGVATLTGTEVMQKTGVQLGGGGGIFTGLKFGKVLGLQVEGLYTYHTAGYNFSSDGSSSTVPISTTHTYIDIPICLQLWLGKGFAFEGGYQQSIALSGTINIDGDTAPDNGILDYGSVVAGMIINMGKAAFLNFRFTKALGYSYVMTTEPSKNMTVQVGLGFRLFNSRQKVFKK